jgi:hypothetical protein
MRLSSPIYRAKLFPTRLEFICPFCEGDDQHKAVIRFGAGGWEFKGNGLEGISIRPSYKSERKGCRLHVTITDGEMIFS